MSYYDYDENEKWWDSAIVLGAMVIWALLIGAAAGIITGYAI